MTIWIILGVLTAALVFLGSKLGALRLSINLFGLILGTWLAGKFGQKLMPLTAKIGDGTNPILLYILPYIAVLLLVYIVFSCLAYVVGDKVYMMYKYKMPDDWRVEWERMNKRVGMCLGAASAACHVLVLGLFAYTVGYWTTQLDAGTAATEDKSTRTVPDYKSGSSSAKAPAGPSGGKGAALLVKIVNPLHKAVRDSGLEKVIAAMDPLPQNYYDLADCVGLVYHNPTAARRFLSYPGTMSLVQAPELQAIVNSDEFHTAWSAKPHIRDLLMTPQLSAVFSNPALREQITALDLADTFTFLSEGKSSKYDSEPLLGRWDIHIPSTVVLAGKNNPALAENLASLAMLRQMMVALLKDVALLVTPDEKIYVKGNFDDYKPVMELINGRAPGTRTNSATSNVLITGSWKKDSGEGKYTVTFEGEGGGKPMPLEVQKNKTLELSFFGGSLVFTKSE